MARMCSFKINVILRCPACIRNIAFQGDGRTDNIISAFNYDLLQLNSRSDPEMALSTQLMPALVGAIQLSAYPTPRMTHVLSLGPGVPVEPRIGHIVIWYSVPRVLDETNGISTIPVVPIVVRSTS